MHFADVFIVSGDCVSYLNAQDKPFYAFCILFKIKFWTHYQLSMKKFYNPETWSVKEMIFSGKQSYVFFVCVFFFFLLRITLSSVREISIIILKFTAM